MTAPRTIASNVRLIDLGDGRECARVEDFVAALSGTLFHRPAWLRAVQRGTGNRALGLLAERAGTPSGWLPLSHIRSPVFGARLVSSGFGVEGGVLAERDCDRALLLQAACELARRRSAGGIELRGGEAGEGWHREEGRRCTFATDLAADDEAQLTAIPRKARAEIRKGMGIDLQVATGTGPEDRAAHYAVYSRSVHALGTPVFPRTLFDAMLDTFADSAEIMTVRYDGRPVSSVLSFYHRGVVMPYWGGGVGEARGLHSTERMYFELMCHARRRGCTRFDFGRSRTGSGPYRFKKNWGFAPDPLTYWSWSADGAGPRDVDPTTPGNARAAGMWKRLPLGLANVIGPLIARGLG